MTTKLQLKFDPNQDFQLQAVESVVGLFDGLPKRTTEFSLSGDVVPNIPSGAVLREQWLLDNLLAVQRNNNLPPSMVLDTDTGLVLEGVGYDSKTYPNFTIEMETGTGKTYVYLRTIHELRRRYGFSKFVVVVPSIAIYEGVIKNFQVTRDHFRALYDNETVNLIQYGGSQLSRLRTFATSTFAEILVITLDAFNKITNNIYKASEKLPGDRKPYQFIQETRPILILDEPQNMESDRAKAALRTLDPLFALRYSATHRTSPNLIYQLTPFEAYRRNLVKKIQVYGVTERENFNQPFLALESVSGPPTIVAKVKTYVADHGRTQQAVLTLRHGDDLHAKTGRDEHAAGYRVVEINAADQFVQFENGLLLRLGDTIGPSRPEIFRVQIEQTVREHMKAQERLRPLGIKVLSLFFIDRVANYIEQNGIIRRLFDDAFNRLKEEYPKFQQYRPEDVRDAYFAKMRTKTGEERAIDTEGANNAEREAEKAAFELIMRNKEQLLSFGEPVSFIFAHSALKEGWDNPNVFQICTLNQTVSELKKRQEIGRGLRLCVNQDGDRVFDEAHNILTVVANESYKSYVERLQAEYVEEGHAKPPAPADASRKPAVRNDRIFQQDRDFRDLWDQLLRRVRYRVFIDSPQLIEECVARLNAQSFPSAVVVVEQGVFIMINYVLRLEGVSQGKAKIAVSRSTTAGETSSWSRSFQEGDDLAALLRDECLRGFRIDRVCGEGTSTYVLFGNAVKLTPAQEYEFQPLPAQATATRSTYEPAKAHPVFNLVDRAARDTGLTRATVNAIFKRMRSDKKRLLFRNPEGFANVFVTELRNALADHITDNLEFFVEEGSLPHDLEELFPSPRQFPQRELVPAGERGLYDQVQIDSGIERTFVEQLKVDGKVVFYFKFPPAFKVYLPKIIGNYNPDWGIGRYDEDGRFVLKLVRETKWGELDELPFPQERRKIECAQKYFGALDIDYRALTKHIAGWWVPVSEMPIQGTLSS